MVRLIVSVSVLIGLIGCNQAGPTKVVFTYGSSDLSSFSEDYPLALWPAPMSASRQCPAVTSVTNVRSGLPGPASAPAGVSFLSDWSTHPTSGGFSGVSAMDTCHIQVDPTFQTWHGKPSVRFEVNPGDDPLSAGDERSEVLKLQDSDGTDFAESETQFYAMSYYFPFNWDGTFLQGNSNSWSSVMELDGWSSLQVGRRTPAGPQTIFFVTASGMHNLGIITNGNWIDLVLEVNWSTGQFAVYRRNQGQTKFSVAVTAADPAAIGITGAYFRQGIYRGPDVNGRTDILWVGPTSRATSFAAAEQAAFGTNSGY
jgi:hypothetical protein